jgi:hypothetical protein
MMPEIAIGRKEILKALHVGDWRTIRDWKRDNEGFRKLVKEHPVNRRPYIIIDEVIRWMNEYNKLKNRNITTK